MVVGWVDLQVNGFRGVDFSSLGLNLRDIDSVGVHLLEQGVVGYCPTIISSPLAVYEHNLPLIVEASKSGRGAQILGVHLEGPFISPGEGVRGVHPEKCIIAPSIELFEKLRTLSQNTISMVTLAPEREGALKLTKHILDTGRAVVSIGHHLARREIIQKAVDSGARAATHVGNGLPEMIHRHDNPIWSILAEDRLTGLFITDGFHLPKEMVRVCLRAKRVSRFIVTSDLVHVAGYPPGEYDFRGVRVVLETNGYLHRKGALQLAGSTCTMMDCMNFMAPLGELDENELVKVGLENPLELLGMKTKHLNVSDPPKIIYESQRFKIESRFKKEHR